MQDVIIIGAGIIGCSTARELSKFDLDVTVIEKCTDISEGTSKANSGLVHAGFDCKPNTVKAEVNAKGNYMYTQLAEELEIPFRRNGALVLCFDKEEHTKIEELYDRALKNNVPDVSIIMGDEVLKLEPNVKSNVYSALYAKTAGVISPYEATIAFAENANNNGVEFKLNTTVTGIEKIDGGYRVLTDNGVFESKVVINCAGIFSDKINNMISEKKYNIVPRKGEYVLFDKSAKHLVERTLFPLPTKLGKGILFTPTVHNNVFIGPSSVDVEDKESLETTASVIESVIKSAGDVVEVLPMREVITSFAGLRANLDGYDDFVIEEAEDLNGFINAIGINSPGLSAAPAIAEKIKDMVVGILEPKTNNNFIAKREKIKTFSDLNIDEKNELIKQDARYGKIICRCESVTEAEIIDSINRPLGATTVDGVKRRTRLSMGRCQGGFCTSKVIEILARELDKDITEISKFGGNSKILADN